MLEVDEMKRIVAEDREVILIQEIPSTPTMGHFVGKTGRKNVEGQSPVMMIQVIIKMLTTRGVREIAQVTWVDS